VALDVRAQILALKVAQLVLRAEIRGLEAWAALEPNDLHAGFAELGREDAAGRAHADDDDIGLAGCHGSSPARRRLRLQADDGGAGERPLALQVLRRERRLRAGKADQAPAGGILVSAVDPVGEHAFGLLLSHR